MLDSKLHAAVEKASEHICSVIDLLGHGHGRGQEQVLVKDDEARGQESANDDSGLERDANAFGI